MRKHITSQLSSEKVQQLRRFSMALTNFVDQLDAPSSFPPLANFSAAVVTDALKWTDLEQNVVYQIVSTYTVNTQHGQSVILSLQKADGSSLGVWACGMLLTELLQNPMIMVNSWLFVLATGQKMSKNG